MTARPRVTVVGDALLDVLVTPERPALAGSDVPARIELRPGGQAANVAVRLARRGVPVALVAPIGRDVTGASIRASLEAEGIRWRGPAAEGSGTVVALRDATGERSMLSDRVRLPAATPDLVRVAAADAAWVVVSGYALLDPVADAIVDAASRAQRRAVLGCAVAADDLATWRSRVERIAPHLVVLNADEAAAVGPIPQADVTAVTDPHGATTHTRAGSLRADVVPGPPAVDTTGAGDAFAAALLASVLAPTWPPTEASLRDALGIAVAAASAVARVSGAQTAVAGERGATLRT